MFFSSNLVTGYQLYLRENEHWTLQTSTKGAVIASGTISFQLNTWCRIELSFHADQITARIDVRGITTVKDTTYSHGMAGIGNDYSRWQYDNFEIRPSANSIPAFALIAAPASRVPAAPALLPPSPLNNGMLPAWSQVEGAAGYRLHVESTSGKYGSTIDAGPLTSFAGGR